MHPFLGIAIACRLPAVRGCDILE